MLEIIVLIYLSRLIGRIVERKNRRSGWYKLMAVLLWIGGEIAGAFVGLVYTGFDESQQIFIYPFALVGAVAGAAVAFVIVKSLPPQEDPLSQAPPPPPPTFG